MRLRICMIYIIKNKELSYGFFFFKYDHPLLSEVNSLFEFELCNSDVCFLNLLFGLLNLLCSLYWLKLNTQHVVYLRLFRFWAFRSDKWLCTASIWSEFLWRYCFRKVRQCDKFVSDSQVFFEYSYSSHLIK